MRNIWKFLYTAIVIPLLWITLQLLSLFRRKVRRGITGREGLFENLERKVEDMSPGSRVWFHASSLGEFEQAKPIIAELTRLHPELRIIVSFFSPSGYDHSQSYPHANIITYIPFDTPGNARRFLDLISPTAAVMVRYDVWPNMIWELHERSIPVFLANATMRKSSARLLPLLRQFHRHLYNSIHEILAASENDATAFRLFGLEGVHIEAVGDTRFDQVTLRCADARKRHLLPATVTADKRILVAGSSWPEDEEVIIPAFLSLRQQFDTLLLVLVPHEPTLEHIEDLERRLNGNVRSIRFSALNEYEGEPVIIVDSVGILLVLYASAHAAYVGGSFRQGIHNVLEAAVYGIPVLFGPRHRNSQEAGQLVNCGGAFVVESARELVQALTSLFGEEDRRREAGKKAASFVASNTGATNRILARINPSLNRSTTP